ncbi:LANO_0C06282g1_1 [Lachancea nothofagi CBS 11611]|uniref:Actin-like protein ARP6 n=1 Tax=Lachancea nothofagi CBS 11611 TaxID=1266666 RepID=A0A1G4J823_9SACH|nr:LANO_0C06282g1_1 [Lachancea nothofagi CBS 11611]
MEESPIVIDNGSYEVKFGPSTNEKPFRALNSIARDKYGNFHLSNQVRSIKDISSVSFTRPHELGQLLSWELETQVWDYCLYNPDAFDGWSLDSTKGKHLVASETCMTIPELSKNMDQVVFEECEFSTMFKAPVPVFVPFSVNDKTTHMLQAKGDNANEREETAKDTETTQEYKSFELVIDSGFNCTWIVPIIKGIPYYKAVKKLDIGGRFLNGFLRETLSFRHYNVMDETILVNSIKENCLLMSPNSYFDSFQSRLKTAKEYVLPDFNTSFQGYLRKPGQQLPEDSQTIVLQDELFSVPETFFHPEIASLLSPGIVETILESISMLPEAFRPLMVGNIVVTGGNFNIPNFAGRLATELQRQCPTDWSCRVFVPRSDASTFGWHCMKDFSSTQSYRDSRVTREEYYEHGVEWCTAKRFGYQAWL